MNLVSVFLMLLAVVCIVNGQLILSKGIDRLKDGAISAGETVKGVGSDIVDSAVGKKKNIF